MSDIQSLLQYITTFYISIELIYWFVLVFLNLNHSSFPPPFLNSILIDFIFLFNPLSFSFLIILLFALNCSSSLVKHFQIALHLKDGTENTFA